jgi:4-hydroxy-4-methyl-2-oxoglutarate aldolase
VDDLREKFYSLSTPTVSDALDRLGIPGQVPGIYPRWPARFVGYAFTGRYRPVGDQGGSVGDYIDDVPEGDVVVLDNQGRMDATVWGDLLTTVAHSRGVAGTVIHGVCRDTDRARDLGYPLFSTGQWMRTGKDRVALDGTQVTLTLGDVQVAPGDLLVGDGDGVVAVPRSRADEVLQVALAIEDAETQIRAAIAEGVPLAQARSDAGYHSLQTRRD